MHPLQQLIHCRGMLRCICHKVCYGCGANSLSRGANDLAQALWWIFYPGASAYVPRHRRQRPSCQRIERLVRMHVYDINISGCVHGETMGYQVNSSLVLVW